MIHTASDAEIKTKIFINISNNYKNNKIDCGPGQLYTKYK